MAKSFELVVHFKVHVTIHDNYLLSIKDYMNEFEYLFKTEKDLGADLRYAELLGYDVIREQELHPIDNRTLQHTNKMRNKMNKPLFCNDDADFSQMTDKEFQDILEDIVAEMDVYQLMEIPNIHSILTEELNDVVLERWAEKNPDYAYPMDDEDVEEDVNDEDDTE